MWLWWSHQTTLLFSWCNTTLHFEMQCGVPIYVTTVFKRLWWQNRRRPPQPFGRAGGGQLPPRNKRLCIGGWAFTFIKGHRVWLHNILIKDTEVTHKGRKHQLSARCWLECAAWTLGRRSAFAGHREYRSTPVADLGCVLQKNSRSTSFENSDDIRQYDYYYYQFLPCS